METTPTSTLDDRLDRISGLTHELISKAHGLMSTGRTSHADLFVLGAIKRVLVQRRGFIDLVKSRNFPCAAGIFRMQLDTAMRLFAFTLVDDPDAVCARIMDGGKLDREKDRDGQRLRDAHIRSKLSPDHPWIDAVYEGSSGFIHLSERHLYNSIRRLDEDSRTVWFEISDTDPHRPDETYFEIVDRFFDATKLAGTMILSFMDARATMRAALVATAEADGEAPDGRT